MISLLVRPRNLYPLRVKMKEEEKRQMEERYEGPGQSQEILRRIIWLMKMRCHLMTRCWRKLGKVMRK